MNGNDTGRDDMTDHEEKQREKARATSLGAIFCGSDESLRATVEAARARIEADEAARRVVQARYSPRAVWRALAAAGYEDRGCIVGGPEALATALSDVIQARVGGALLYGRCGNGKTLAARWMQRNGAEWAFVEPVKEAWRYNHRAYPLADWSGWRGRGLVIDDLGAEPAINHYGETAELYTELLTMHFADWYGKWTPRLVVTTNFEPADLAERYGARVWSRVLSHLTPVEFAGNDQRQRT